MNENLSLDTPTKRISKRFVSLDFARGIAIFVMLILHIVHQILDIDYLMSPTVIIDQPIIALSILIFIPFFGGLAGFFLIVSAASNMISMYRDLEKGKSIRSLVLKQVIGGFLLLIFAMLCEGLIGYNGAFGDFLLNLNNPGDTNWQIMLWRWNHFETIHTIAWCLIFNGCIHGLMSLRGNWKNRKQMIITYIVMAVAVVGLTQPVWMLFGKIGPGYPFTEYAEKIIYATPRIGFESFWHIIRAPFLGIFASPIEPLFPYLAVSFIGSIIGIVLSKPKEKINRNFPRTMFLIGLVMFISGLIGIVISIFNIMNSQGIDQAIAFYLDIIYHRHWTNDNLSNIYVSPKFGWLAQFLAVNGWSIILLMLLFRLNEFRGKSKEFANRSKIIRRYGTIAFTNYNNQWIYYLMFALTSYMIYRNAYQKLLWFGTFLTIILTFLVYSFILWLWEKIGYIGSLEWFIRTGTNNLVPLRRERFDTSVKWWQKGQVDVENTFYNADWINIVNKSENLDTEETKELIADTQLEKRDSKLAFRMALTGMFSILFALSSIFALFISVNAMKNEGKNKHNKAAFIISIITIVLLVAGFIALFFIPIDTLGIF